MIDLVVNKIDGLAALEQRLSRLPVEMERKILGTAMREGADVIVAVAKAHAPIGKPVYTYGTKRVKNKSRAGQLRKSIRAMGKGSMRASYYVLPIGFGAKGFYGRFLERGWIPTGPHKKFRGAHGLTWKSARKVLQRGRKKITPLRFMMHAATSQMTPAVEAVARSIERSLQRMWV